jgi:hypothetical protein
VCVFHQGALFGDLARYPAADHGPNATRKTYDWDSGEPLGEIPEVSGECDGNTE